MWSEGGAVGNDFVVIHGKSARFAGRRSVHKSIDRPFHVFLCHLFRSIVESITPGLIAFVRPPIALSRVSGPILGATAYNRIRISLIR